MGPLGLGGFKPNSIMDTLCRALRTFVHYVLNKSYFCSIVSYVVEYTYVVSKQVMRGHGLEEDSNASGGSCSLLVECLEEIAAWSEAHPDHAPLAIFLQVSISQSCTHRLCKIEYLHSL